MDIERGRPPALKSAAISRRADVLFKAMVNDYLLREQFVTDPAQVFSEFVHGTKLAPEQVSIYNQFVYSFFSNTHLLSWFHRYFLRYREHPPTRQQFLVDFAHALIRYGGGHVVLALLRASIEGQATLNFEEMFPFFVLFAPGVLHQPQGQAFATFIGPTFATEEPTFATEIGPTFLTAGPTFATELGPTFVTDVASTETGPTERGTDTGPTERGTDTGPTEPGTQTGPGNIAFFGPSYWTPTLAALSQYAVQLRDSGVLNLVSGV